MMPHATAPERSAGDRLADALRALGLTLTDRRLSDHPRSLTIGLQLRLRCSELVYRRPADRPDLLLVVLYRRLAARPPGLANPFADLLWFLRFCTEPRFGLARVLCKISTDRYRRQGEDGLDDARMIRFCERILGADWIQYDGRPWLYRDVAPLRERLLSLARGASSLSHDTGAFQ